LEDVFSIFVGASKSDQIIDGGRYWIVDMGSISIDGKLVVTKSTNFADDFLQCGDLVMPKDDIGGGNIIGKVGYVDIDTKYVLGDHVFALRSKQGNSLFYSYVINNYQINSAFRSKVKGSAQLGLSRKDVEEQKVPFPMIEEQTAIATVLSDMDAELAALERQRDKTKAIKQGMMQELLTGRIRLQ
jgi:type I restriction enzyme S subunit